MISLTTQHSIYHFACEVFYSHTLNNNELCLSAGIKQVDTENKFCYATFLPCFILFF